MFYRLLAVSAGSSLLMLAAISAQAQAVAPPAAVVSDLADAGANHGAQALLSALDHAIAAHPELVATPESAAALARAAATPVAEFRGANLSVYRDIADHIVSAAPANDRAAVRDAVVGALTPLVSADPHSGLASIPPRVPEANQSPFNQPAATPMAQRDTPTPLGIPLGSFVLYSEAQVAELYDDNIYATRTNQKADLINVVSPQFLLQSNWGRHELNLEAHTDVTTYADHSAENSVDYRFSGEGRYDISDTANFFGGALAMRSHEDRASPDDVNGTAPTTYQEYRTYGGVTQRFDAVTARLGATFEHLNFDNTPTADGFIDNQDRNRNHITTGLWMGYSLSSALQPYVQGSADLRRYERHVDDFGYARDSNGYRLAVGTKINLPGNLGADVYGGYMRQDYYADSALPSVSTPDLGASVRWQARPTTLVVGWLNRAIDETTLAGASADLYSSVGASIDQNITPSLLVTLRANWSKNEFQGIGRTDYEYDTGAGLRYLINQSWFVAADYRYQHRDSSIYDALYSRNQVFLRIGAQY